MTDKTATENEHAIADDELAQLQAEVEAEHDDAERVGDYMEAEPEGPSTAEMLMPLVSMGCKVAAPNWQIQKAEVEALAESYGELVDKYFPGGVGEWGPELNAALVTAAIFGPRLGTPRHKQPAKPKADNEIRRTDEGVAHES